MKFVHFTDATLIDRIKHNGIHLGDGRRGRGVYCVPLFFIAQIQSSKFDPTGDTQWYTSTPISTGQLWKWWMRQHYPDGRPMAVVYDAPANCWPLDTYLNVQRDFGTQFIQAIDQLAAQGVHIEPEDRTFVLQAAKQGYGSTCYCQVQREHGLGLLLHAYRTITASLDEFQGVFSDGLEVVMRQLVPPKNIARLIPHYQTNHRFKEHKTSQHKRRQRYDHET